MAIIAENMPIKAVIKRKQKRQHKKRNKSTDCISLLYKYITETSEKTQNSISSENNVFECDFANRDADLFGRLLRKIWMYVETKIGFVREITMIQQKLLGQNI